MISRHFQADRTSTPTHSITVCEPGSDYDEASLALEVADMIVASLCVRCPQYHVSWLQRVNHGTPHASPHIETALNAFISAGIGLPTTPPPEPTEHQQGFVAQYLWHALIGDQVHADPNIWMHDAPFRVIDHGADGFVVHRLVDNSLAFRLWEIKKSTSTFANTLSKACSQIDQRAHQYLAEMTRILDKDHDPEIAEFGSHLMEYWLAETVNSGIGIGILTSRSNVPTNRFHNLGTRFPNRATPDQLHGLIAATEDLIEFTRQVRDIVWIGL